MNEIAKIQLGNLSRRGFAADVKRIAVQSEAISTISR